MLQILHKILALILALAVLFSTLSFTVEKHVCMGEVTSVSYFEQVESCGMEEMACDDGDRHTDQIDRSRCCDNISELIPGDTLEQQAIEGLEIEQYQFLASYITSYLLGLEKADLTDQIDLGPDPPTLERDIQVLYQTFLI